MLAALAAPPAFLYVTSIEGFRELASGPISMVIMKEPGLKSE